MHFRRLDPLVAGTSNQLETFSPPFPLRADLGMLSGLKTYSLLGNEALPVEVEVDIAAVILPKTILVGLPKRPLKRARIELSGQLAVLAVLAISVLTTGLYQPGPG